MYASPGSINFNYHTETNFITNNKDVVVNEDELQFYRYSCVNNKVVRRALGDNLPVMYRIE